MKIHLPQGSRISSGFGPRKGSSIISSNHSGIDVTNPAGLRLLWPFEVRGVTSAYENKWGGLQAIAFFRQDGSEFRAVVGHCTAAWDSEDGTIGPGEWWLDGGDTGTQTTGAHWHISLFKDGKLVDPAPYVVFDAVAGAGWYKSYRDRVPKVLILKQVLSKQLPDDFSLPEEITPKGGFESAALGDLMQQYITLREYM